MSENTITTPVLIVGAGPAGLTAAVTLARHGVDALLVERRPRLSSLPRATGVSLRTMELLRSWGVEDAVRAGGVDVDWTLRACATLATAAGGPTFELGFPTREQSALISPTAPACVPQDHLEPVLLDHLEALPHGRAELGTEVVGIEHRRHTVLVTLRDVASGATRRVEARYVIAADGAHSRVRRALGIELRGPDHLTEVSTALFRAPLWDVVGDARHVIYGVDAPEAGGAFLPAGGDRWLYGIQWDQDTASAEEFTADRLTRLVRGGAGVDALPVVIERVGHFSFAAQLADRFREGDTFLVGDAAHRVTPRGGTGMNTAIHDGFDLGWKLAWVLRGWADRSLLDSYEAERRPVAAHNVARSADPRGSYRGADEEVRVDLGGRLPHVWVPTPDGRRSTLDLVGEGFTLFTGPQAGTWASAAAGADRSVPVRVQRLDAIAARAMAIPADGALLVRPDGVPTARWATSADAVGDLPVAA